MGSIVLGWPNRTDEATLSGGSWKASLPLNNLKTRQITEPARSTNATTANTQFDFDLTQNRSLRVFSLVNHNLSQDATWRITLGTTAGASDVYDSGWLAVWKMSFVSDLQEWESESWWNGISDTDHIGAPFAAVKVADDWYSTRYGRVEIDDTTNADGYVQIGRPFIGGGFIPVVNASTSNYQENWNDLSTIQTADSGAEWFNQRRRYRTVKLILPYVSENDFSFVYEMQRRQGTTEEIFYIPDLNDDIMNQRAGFLGRAETLSAISYPYPRYRVAPVALKEIL